MKAENRVMQSHDNKEIKRLHDRIGELEALCAEYEKRNNIFDHQLSTLIQNSPDVILNIDRNGKILYVNRVYDDLDIEEVINKTVFDFVPPEQNDLIKDALNEVFRSKKIVKYESSGAGPGGLTLWYDVSLSPVIHDGKVKSAAMITRDITDRKKTEEQLAKFRKFVDTSEQAMGMADLEGNIIFANPSLVKILGVNKPDDLYNRNVRSFYDDNDVNKVENEMMPLMMEKGYATGEMVLHGFDGRLTPAIQSIFLLRDEKGNPVNIANVITDISDRKQIEETLRQTTERFRSLVETTSDWIWEVDRNGVYTYVSPRCNDLLGYEPREMIGNPPFNYIHPDEVDSVRERFQKLIDDRKPIEWLINSNVHKNGKTVIMETNGIPFYDAGGEFAGYRGVDRDITERRKSEEQLAVFRKFIDTSEQAMGIAGLDGDITFANPALCRILGMKEAGELYGKNVRIFYTPEEVQRLENEVLPSVMEKGHAFTEISLQGINGEVTPAIQSIFLIYDEDGNPAHLANVITDITEQKKLRSELEAKASELEAANSELKEATEQLVQSEKLSALGELTAGVAHELNQPLNGIKIISQSILRDLDKGRFDEKEIEQDLRESVSLVDKMAEIINHMRIFTRRTEGMKNEIIDITEVIEGPFKLLGKQLEAHNIEVIKNISSGLPGIPGDPIRLEQVFMNLITNARNALDNSGNKDRKIEINVNQITEEESPLKKLSVVCEFRDNGIGIPDEIKNKILQPFFTTQVPGKGTGLGLSVSNKIIEEHNGTMDVTSEAGKWSSFKVILPAQQ